MPAILVHIWFFQFDAFYQGYIGLLAVVNYFMPSFHIIAHFLFIYHTVQIIVVFYVIACADRIELYEARVK